jgi:hypothetical protein
MRSRRKFAVLAVTVAGMLILANTARQWVGHFSPSDSDNIIFIDQYALTGTYDESLVVIANSVDGAQAGTVYGDTALVGRQDVIFHGATTGDLTIMGQKIDLAGDVAGDTAIMGDIIVLSGNFSGAVTVVGKFLTVEPNSTFQSLTVCVNDLDDNRTRETKQTQAIRPCQDKAALLATFAPFQVMSGNFDIGGSELSDGVRLFSVLTSLMLTGLAALAVTVFPGQFSRMQEAILTMPRGLTALGLMTVLLGIGLTTGIGMLLSVVPILSIVFVPLGLLFLLALGVMIVMGWITLALLLGNYLMIRITRAPAPPLVVVALGSFALFGLWHILALIPFGFILALLLMAALGSLGLGGTLATRCGTRPLRRQYFVQG